MFEQKGSDLSTIKIKAIFVAQCIQLVISQSVLTDWALWYLDSKQEVNLTSGYMCVRNLP